VNKWKSRIEYYGANFNYLVLRGVVMKVIIAISGASGVIYGIRLLQQLKKADHTVELIITAHGKEVIELETDTSVLQLEARADAVYPDDDLTAPPSSGSHLFDAMVICPCSMSTLSKIAMGISDTLIARSAAVCLKERRRFIIVPRETPLSTIYLRNMLTLSESGVIILPPSPAFYHHPETLDNIVDFVVGKTLDSLGVGHTLFPRWGD